MLHVFLLDPARHRLLAQSFLHFCRFLLDWSILDQNSCSFAGFRSIKHHGATNDQYSNALPLLVQVSQKKSKIIHYNQIRVFPRNSVSQIRKSSQYIILVQIRTVRCSSGLSCFCMCCWQAPKNHPSKTQIPCCKTNNEPRTAQCNNESSHIP